MIYLLIALLIILTAVQQNIAKTGVRLSADKIDTLYKKLYPLTQADEAQKALHIKNIRQKTAMGVKEGQRR